MKRVPGAKVLGALVLAAAVLFPLPLRAQPVMPGRFDVAGGIRWAGRANLGAADATETSPDGARFRLFSSEQMLAPAVGVEERLGFRLTRVLQLEVAASWSKPELRSHITSDVEGIPDVTLAETVTQWTIEGAVVVHLGRWSLGPSGIPFVSAGGGYLRQVHEGGTLVQTGRIYHVGGGVNYLFTHDDAGRLKGAGVRVDGRAVIRSGGTTVGDRARVAPALGASLFARF